MLAALAGPPFFPPFLPSSTAAGFFLLAMLEIYVTALENTSATCLDFYVTAHV